MPNKTTVDRAALLSVLEQSAKPLGLGEIQARLELNPGMRTELKRALREQVKKGRLVKEGKRFVIAGRTFEAAAESEQPAPERLPERAPAPREEPKTKAPALIGSKAGRKGKLVIGTLHRHEDGFGFVQPLTGPKGDFYLPREEARKALDGDLVKIQILAGERGRTSGKLIEVVERRRTRAIGTYLSRGRQCLVAPVDRALGEAIVVRPSRLVQDGDMVKVAITRGPSASAPAEGEVLEKVGPPGDPATEVLESAYGQGFSDAFPADVQDEAAELPGTLAHQEIIRRRDLRDLPLVTIDGEDARDFDDAVYAERVGDRYRLVVAIADVAHYVRPDHPLDHEALRRATSVYFPSMVLPMLPERLSNGLCSLKPDEDRLCTVADMVFEKAGGGARCVEADIYEGVMRSAARCTYTEVAAVLGGKHLPERERFKERFQLMEELALRLNATRLERGSIDFDLPEVKVVLDEQKRPLRLEKRERNIAHRIVEEFMLAANEAVARHFSTRGLPTVYRVHGEPDEEKLENFLALARAHGFALQAGEEISGRSLNELLKKLAGSPEQKTLNTLLLRSMMQAIYSAENIGHFGLAAPFYLHFTSPIRRYPDLIVHRLLKEHWKQGARSLSDGERGQLEERLDAVSARSSERERAAMVAEREVDDFFEALFMKDKVGEEYDGTVSAVAEFGVFVELTGVYVEGLVKAENIGSGANLDAERHRLVFDSGLSFGLGDQVRVKVASVNMARRQIDFELLAIKGEKHVRPAQEPGARPERAPRGRSRSEGPAGNEQRGKGQARKPEARKGEARKGGGKKAHRRRR